MAYKVVPHIACKYFVIFSLFQFDTLNTSNITGQCMRQNYMKVNLSSLKLSDQLCKKHKPFFQGEAV